MKLSQKIYRRVGVLTATALLITPALTGCAESAALTGQIRQSASELSANLPDLTDQMRQVLENLDPATLQSYANRAQSVLGAAASQLDLEQLTALGKQACTHLAELQSSGTTGKTAAADVARQVAKSADISEEAAQKLASQAQQYLCPGK